MRPGVELLKIIGFYKSCLQRNSAPKQKARYNRKNRYKYFIFFFHAILPFYPVNNKPWPCHFSGEKCRKGRVCGPRSGTQTPKPSPGTATPTPASAPTTAPKAEVFTLSSLWFVGTPSSPFFLPSPRPLGPETGVLEAFPSSPVSV